MQPDFATQPFLVAALCLTLIVSGCFSGTMAGLFGIGGGIILVPVLSTIFSLLGVSHADSMHVVVATSLATIIPSSYAALNAHAKRGGIDMAVLRHWGPMIALGSLLGSIVAGFINGKILSLIFGCFLLFVALRFWRQARQTGVTGTMPHPLIQRLLAFAIGSSSAMLGIGGGILGVTALSHCGLTIQRAIGTASTFGFMVAVPGVTIYLFSPAPATIPYGTLGLVHPLALALLVPGAMLCAPIGARLAHQLPLAKLRLGFAGLLVLLGGKMLTSAFI
jgi:uncharacterized membrane protein YfcA